MTEQWRTCAEFPDYEVSRSGVRRRSNGKILRPWSIGGYAAVGLRRDGQTYKRLVARLYGAAFLGLAPDQQINHRSLRASSRADIVHGNRGKANPSSKFKGVSRAGRRWLACIEIDGRTKMIGLFAREADAAKAYDAWARQLWGPAAFQNFPTKHS